MSGLRLASATEYARKSPRLMVASPAWISLPILRRRIVGETDIRSDSRRTRSNDGSSSSHASKGIAKSRVRSGSEGVASLYFSTSALYSSMALRFHVGWVARWSNAQHAKRCINEFFRILMWRRTLTIGGRVNYSSKDDIHDSLLEKNWYTSWTIDKTYSNNNIIRCSLRNEQIDGGYRWGWSLSSNVDIW